MNAEFSCSKCGATNFSIAYIDPIPEEMTKFQLCFYCNFWRECADDKDLIVINGEAYSDGGMKLKEFRGFLGFGGRLFQIERFDGRIIQTNNLWNRGTVPAIWRQQVPDNAKWKVVDQSKIGNGEGFFKNPASEEY